MHGSRNSRSNRRSGKIKNDEEVKEEVWSADFSDAGRRTSRRHHAPSPPPLIAGSLLISTNEAHAPLQAPSIVCEWPRYKRATDRERKRSLVCIPRAALSDSPTRGTRAHRPPGATSADAPQWERPFVFYRFVCGLTVTAPPSVNLNHSRFLYRSLCALKTNMKCKISVN